MKSSKLIRLIQEADPTGNKTVILTDAANNWYADPMTAYNGRYSTRRNTSSLDSPLSKGEIKAGHKEENLLTGPGVKKVVILMIDI